MTLLRVKIAAGPEVVDGPSCAASCELPRTVAHLPPVGDGSAFITTAS